MAAARPKEEAERLMAPEIEIFASDFVQSVNSSNFCHIHVEKTETSKELTSINHPQSPSNKCIRISQKYIRK